MIEQELSALRTSVEALTIHIAQLATLMEMGKNTITVSPEAMEALANVDAPKKRGRKPKEAEVVQVTTDEPGQQTLVDAGVEMPKVIEIVDNSGVTLNDLPPEQAKAATIDEVRDALIALTKVKGKEFARKLLADVAQSANVTSIPEDKRSTVVAACKEAM